MTNLLIMLGIVTLIAWGYIALGALAYATIFRQAFADRVYLSALWPYTGPYAALLWLRLQVLRRKQPRARVRK